MNRAIRLLGASGLLALTACELSTRARVLEDQALSVAGLDRLAVEAGAGRLDVVGVPGLDRIEVEATLYWAATQSTDRVLDALVYALRPVGRRALLDVGFVRHGLVPEPFVDAVVRVPRGFAVEIRDGSGELTLADVGPADIDDGSGDLSVRGVDGPLVLRDGSGTVAVEAVTGPVRIDDDSGDLSVRAVRGSVRIADGSGDMTVVEVDGDVDISDGSGDIRVRSVGGSVRISDGSGDIVLEDAPDATILRDESGRVVRI